MNKITSELTFSEVEFTIPKVPQSYYTDNNIEFYVEDLKYVSCTKTRYKDNFYFYINDIIIGNSLRHYGEYTENEIQLLRNFIQPGYVVYDIGANIGYHTLGLAERAKHVYAFEPNKKNYKLLEKNTKHNKNITIFDSAVSDSVGTVTISDFDLEVQGNYGEMAISNTGYTVPSVTIDSLVSKRKIMPPNLIKIDVEGYEYNVICGMKQTIEDNQPVIFYEHLHGDDLPKVHEYLQTLNYKFYWFPCMNYNPNNYKQNRQNIFGNGGVMNVLAVPVYLDVKTNLLEKITVEDTWQNAVERMQNA